jgi:hypothetical protein
MNKDDEGWNQAGTFRQKHRRVWIGEAHHGDGFHDVHVQLTGLTISLDLDNRTYLGAIAFGMWIGKVFACSFDQG